MDGCSRTCSLIAAHRQPLAECAQILLTLERWSLEAPMLLIEAGPDGTSARPGTVGQLSSWLEHLDPELDAFVHLRQAGVDFDRARAQCLKEQGEAFETAWAKALATRRKNAACDSMERLTSTSTNSCGGRVRLRCQAGASGKPPWATLRRKVWRRSSRRPCGWVCQRRVAWGWSCW